jgi:hypothetical protein
MKILSVGEVLMHAEIQTDGRDGCNTRFSHKLRGAPKSERIISSRFANFIYLLTAIGLSPGGRNTVHIYTQTIQRTIQNKQYIEQHNNNKQFYIIL